jgi:hypothetical protein
MQHYRSMTVSPFPLVELDPELAAAVCNTEIGPAIKHPFVNAVPYAPPFASFYNEQLVHKRATFASAVKASDWNTAVFVHERPWRVDVLASLADYLDDHEYWPLVREVWMDAENITECRTAWDELLRSPRGHRELLTADEDQGELANLPDVVTLFQGRTTHRDDGWSWTLKREVGEWFASRFALFENAKPVLATTTIEKSSIHALLLGRGEHEVLVDPFSLGAVTTERL